MNLDVVRQKAALAVLSRWPVVASALSQQMQRAASLLPPEDAETLRAAYSRWVADNVPPAPAESAAMSAFLQQMEVVEGQLRLEVSEEGCLCKMDIRATTMRRGAGVVIVEVRTLHDAVCPVLWRATQDDQEIAIGGGD